MRDCHATAQLQGGWIFVLSAGVDPNSVRLHFWSLLRVDMAKRELNLAARRFCRFDGSGRWQRCISCWGRTIPEKASDFDPGEEALFLAKVRRLCTDSFEPGPILPDQSVQAAKAIAMEKVWSEFFSDPSHWWDYRLEKANARYPDFKHKRTMKGLWLDGKINPPWVEAKLATMAPGTVQTNVFTWNASITKHVADGNFEKAIALFHQMLLEGTSPDRSIFLQVVKACAASYALDHGRHVHEQIRKAGCESDLYVGSSLVDMYAKCGSLEDARRVFNNMTTRNVVSWNAMIHGYVKSGQGHKALSLYRQMQLEEVVPDCVTLIGMLQACAGVGALEQGRHVHDQIIQRGFNLDLSVRNSLIDMYTKCGSPEEAWKVFSNMPERSEVSWNAMIQGYVKSGRGLKALELSHQMQQEGWELGRVTFLGILNACASVGALDDGRRFHERIIECGYEGDIFVSSSLIDMYAKCGCPEDARRLFDKMAIRNVVSWNAMILGYVKCGQGQKALDLSQQMQQEGVMPDSVTFVGLLSACAIIPAIEEGRKVHEQIMQRGDEFELTMGSSLIDMYAKCGSIELARNIFDKMPTRSVRTWNVMILGYARCGQGHKAWLLSQQMQQDGIQMDPVTYVGMLSACASAGFIDYGKRIHDQIIENGLEGDIFIANSLIDMYAECGSMRDARKVFSKMPSRNVVSWNAMILGYAKCGQWEKALELSQQMQQEGMKPDPVTFVGMLNACASKGALDEGRQVHQEMIRSGFESEAFVGSSLVDMYAKCWSMEDAWDVFNKMPTRSVATWNAMILGCAKSGEGQKAIELFQQMELEMVVPDSATFVAVLTACGRLRALDEGRRIHNKVSKVGHSSDVNVNNALIDMYARCGSIGDARRTFNKVRARNVYTWNAMILAYSSLGMEQHALKLSEEMQQEQNPASFFGVPIASTGAAALEEGRRVHEQAIRIGWESDVFLANVVDMYGKGQTAEDAQDNCDKVPTEIVVS